MGMTIDEIIQELERTKDYPVSDPASNEALDGAIDIIRKYQKIKELYDYWRSGKCEYTISCMENIGKVLKDGND